MPTLVKAKDRHFLFLLLFMLLKIVLEFLVVNPVYELHRDEYLYLNQSSHPAFGYVSVPPLTAWVGSIVELFGSGFFLVHFFPALFGALTIAFCWFIVQELGGGLKAKISTAFLLVCSVLLRLDILFQPNSFDVLSWTAIYYLLIKFVNTRKNNWLVWLGPAIGLAILNKYNVAFLLVALVPSFLLTKERTIFLNRSFWIGILIAFLIALPNVIWQLKNHLPVVHHMHELVSYQLDNVSRKDFLFFQALFFFVGDLVLISAFVAFLFYPPFRPYRFIGWSFLITIGIFLAMRGKDYYSIGLYPVLIAAGAAFLDRILNKGWQSFLLPSIVVVNAIVFISVSKFILPLLSPQQIRDHPGKFQSLGLLKWEDGIDHSLPQDFADMQGWREMAVKTEQVYAALPDSEKKRTIIICDNYGQAGAVNYYSRGRLPQAVSFNADYVAWFPDHKISNVIAVKEVDAIELAAFAIGTEGMGSIRILSISTVPVPAVKTNLISVN
ncbi:MAG: glycosyltransferase family 39 protein, partial [Flavisolibacter sp.]